VSRVAAAEPESVERAAGEFRFVKIWSRVLLFGELRNDPDVGHEF
jgi:hypothetical protein